MPPTPKAPKRRGKPALPELVGRAELAKMKGVSTSAVSHAAKGPLADARVGSRIDIEHPDVVAWLTAGSRGDAPGPATAAPVDTVRTVLLDLLRRKREAEVERLEIANAERMRRLVLRDEVDRVFAAIDGGNRRLLVDATRTIARRLLSHWRSGGTLVEAERVVHDLLSTQLEQTKSAMLRAFPDSPTPTKTAKKAKKGAA
jgi:hypothetical protein